MLNKQTDYYARNREKFERLYKGKYIVIYKTKIIGVYDTHAAAYNETIKEYEVGSFIIENP